MLKPSRFSSPSPSQHVRKREPVAVMCVLTTMPGVEIEEDLADKFRRRVAAKGLESKVCMCAYRLGERNGGGCFFGFDFSAYIVLGFL